MRIPSPSARIHTLLRNASRSEWYESAIELQDLLVSRDWRFNHDQYDLGDLGWVSPLAGPTNDPRRQNEIWMDLTDAGLNSNEPLWVLAYSSGGELAEQPLSEVFRRLPELDGRAPVSN